MQEAGKSFLLKLVLLGIRGDILQES